MTANRRLPARRLGNAGIPSSMTDFKMLTFGHGYQIVFPRDFDDALDVGRLFPRGLCAG